ncbi:MAG: glycosyltransferase, partial [Muribaculaceae bacterium]|nr:glycosyltransferase [Muribaculaceae bacterium]
MKILHVITSLRTGGAEKLMVDLLPRLKAKGLEVDLLLFDGSDTPFRQEIESKGIKVFDLGVGGSVYSPLRLLKLILFLKNYHVVHTHNTAPQLYGAIASFFKRVKLVTTEHGGSNRRRAIKGFRTIDKWMYRQYDNVICIAEKTKENLLNYLGVDLPGVVTINNGVDIARYANALPSEELEAIAPDSRKIMMVAGFRWEKDQDTLIKAVVELPDHFHLFLVGDGVRRPELEALAYQSGISDRVHFLGMRSDVDNLLHAVDYIVMSSHFEGLSLSSVEGMSVGKPFLASDVDGLREVVQGAGILFPHEDPKALAEEIMQLENSSELYKSISTSCYERAWQFDLNEMVEGYFNIYCT